jgi:bla regulator protein blaR1
MGGQVVCAFLPGFSKRGLAIAGIAAAMSMPTISQPPAAARGEFEVASIKRSDPSHIGAQTYFVPGGKFTALTAPLKSLVCFAYQLRDHQVAGGPGWIDSEPFDISAKAEVPASYDEIRIMLQTLLADRFQLKFHRETKEQPVYALVLAKNGPKLQEVKNEGRGVGSGARGRINGNGADMATLATVLADKLGRSVIDRTGLKGVYDFLLTWTPDEVRADDPGPSLFTAIQEQLGLKLESTKGPVEVLVIDHAEKPSEN